MENFTLGHWVVKPTESTIEHQEVKQLDFKLMELLCYLVKHKQQVVSREALLEALWPNQVTGDDVLNVAMSSLRKALGDDPKRPVFIKTIPRKGYQLIGDVSFAAVTTESSHKPKRAVHGLLLLLIMCLAFWYFSDSHQQATSPLKLAVMPFDNLSQNDDNLYISEGLTESIINRLAQQQELRVTSRTSTQEIKKQSLTVKEIADKLDVDWVLEGSIQVENDQLLVTAQLIEAETDEHAWSETYQKTVTDLFSIQSEISDQIARRFNQPDDQGDMPISPLAFNQFLRARYYMNRGDTEQAHALFSAVVAEQPDYADAWAMLAQLEFLKAYMQKGNVIDLVAKGNELAQKAHKLNPGSAFTNLNLALARFYHSNDFTEANIAFEKAFALNNQDLMIQEWFMNFLLITQQFERAKEIIAHAQQVSPLIYNKTNLFQTLYYAKDFSGALSELDSINPYLNNKNFISVSSAWIYLSQGDATALYQMADDLLTAFGLEQTYHQEFKMRLQNQGLEASLQYLLTIEALPLDAFSRAELMAWSGDHQGAIKTLKPVIEQKQLRAYTLAIEPAFLVLHQDPEFAEMMKSLNLDKASL